MNVLGGFGFGVAANSSVAGGSSTFVSNYKLVSKSSDYVILSTDSGTIFNNAGAGGNVNFTLPAAIAIPASNAVYYFGFEVDVAQTITVKGNGTDTMRAGAAISTATTGSLVLTNIGTTLWLMNNALGKWTLMGNYIGNLTVN